MHHRFQYFILCEELCEALSRLGELEESFLEIFPKEFSKGLFSSSPLEKRTLLDEYGRYLKQALPIIDQTDRIAQGLTERMTAADEALDEDTVCRCDKLLLEYRSFLRERDLCLQKIEASLQTNKTKIDTHPPYQALKSLHTETLRLLDLCNREQINENT